MKHFNKALLEIDEADDQVIMTTFQAWLNNPNLVFSSGKIPPTLMTGLLFKAQQYMNGEDTLTAKGENERKKKMSSHRERRGITKTIPQTLRPIKVAQKHHRRKN